MTVVRFFPFDAQGRTARRSRSALAAEHQAGTLGRMSHKLTYFHI